MTIVMEGYNVLMRGWALSLVAILAIAGCTQPVGPLAGGSNGDSITPEPSGGSASSTSTPSGSGTTTTTTSSNSPSGQPGQPGEPGEPHPVPPTNESDEGSYEWTWGPASAATIRPGVQTFTNNAQCTANFIFSNATQLFIGQAAHCSAGDDATKTNGCEAKTGSIGGPVEIDGASKPGILVYSSWIAMQEIDESDTNACRYNDFALIAIDPADFAKVHPSVQSFGGPTGTADASKILIGDKVFSYGNSGLRFGISATSPHEGYVIAKQGDGWSTVVYTHIPGVPGDSGSGVLTEDGEALGILVTVQVAPVAGSNGVTSLDHALPYANSVGGLDLRLEVWDEFRGGLLP